jgi:hypothetical protein
MNRPVVAKERRGAVLVLVAVSTFLLVSILALSIDAGSLQHQRRMAQTAADAGALAGAQEILRKRPFAVITSALGEAQRNGFTNGVGGDVVTVTYPSTTAPFTGAGYVTVNVERTASNFFAKIFGMATSVIRTQATAGLVPDDLCIVALNPTAANSLYMAQPQSVLRASNCDAAVNSSSPTGANVNGTLAPHALGVSGPSVGGLNNITTPNVGFNVPPTPDPLAYLGMPVVPATCDHVQRNNGDNIAGTVTLNPGTYCGGIVLKPGAHVTLSQGLYILRGGGLDITGGSGTSIRSSGSGVTFFNTAPPPATEVANYHASYAWRVINIQSATVTVNLSADIRPLSALTPFPGVLFYTDRAAPPGLNVFRAGSGSTMDGTMYFPTQSVDFQSGTNFTIKGGLVADKISVSQNVTITFTGSNGGLAFQSLKQATIVD